mmetsp:Transcript_14774/g.45591  ORF Transcript_14774/g.45591 Transcript_14774/m.45591 type:complete len:141 (+) Transcript_14774:98-520(+)
MEQGPSHGPARGPARMKALYWGGAHNVAANIESCSSKVRANGTGAPAVQGSALRVHVPVLSEAQHFYSHALQEPKPSGPGPACKAACGCQGMPRWPITPPSKCETSDQKQPQQLPRGALPSTAAACVSGGPAAGCRPASS